MSYPVAACRGSISGRGTKTLTLQPDAASSVDTVIVQNAATNNYGISTTLPVGQSGAADSNSRGLIKFDLSSIPADATIESATLTLYHESETNTTNRTVNAHRALTEWFEGAKNGAAPDAEQDGSTYNLRNANGSVEWTGGAGGGSGTDFVATATNGVSITDPTASFSWNLTVDVQAFVAGTASNYGWWLVNASEATGSTRKIFTSSDGATEANRPKLVVVYS